MAAARTAAKRLRAERPAGEPPVEASAHPRARPMSASRWTTTCGTVAMRRRVQDGREKTKIQQPIRIQPARCWCAWGKRSYGPIMSAKVGWASEQEQADSSGGG